MTPTTNLYLGDCRAVMADMDADSIDTIITDPPYGLEFMGKGWDKGVPGVEFWDAALRVAKPGAHLLAFGGTRTFHRLASAIEDAGWELRDMLMWVYGTGFPKSFDISKALDKLAGAEREVIGIGHSGKTAIMQGIGPASTAGGEYAITAPATVEAALWDGWGTALKPAWEPIIVGMKPLAGSFVDNALAYGVAGLNIDGARIPFAPGDTTSCAASAGSGSGQASAVVPMGGGIVSAPDPLGRWPANLVLSHDPRCNGACHPECPVKLLDDQSGVSTGRAGVHKRKGGIWKSEGDGGLAVSYGDTGGASRFFYCAKASVAERDAGLEGLELSERPGVLKLRQDGSLDGKPTAARKNDHPTVKPLSLMQWLCRLTKTPTGGIVFDPFMGSGSTGCAAVLEGRDFIGCEIDFHYLTIAGARIEHWRKQAEQA